MKKLRLLWACAMLCAAPAFAQVVTTPQQISGYGVVSATAASALVSTATLSPNSGVWPSSPQMVYFTNATGSAGVVFICPLGGTCSAAVGIPLASGSATYGVLRPSVNATVFATTTATVIVQW